ncbi:MAG: ribonuclease Z [Chloroflexi bacterium]|nr:ribonuclease Z [Chloroflexota bacterium]
MFEIVFLGTSASAPSIHRGLSAQAILAGEHRFLIDCGEGTQRQILRSGIGFKRLNRILLTHAHLDHILGLGGLISTFAHWENIDHIEIWGGKPTLQRVDRLLFDVVLHFERLPIQIDLRELKPGPFIQTKDFTVTAIPVQHRGAGNFGFVFQEKTYRPFLAAEAEALGVPAGPERGQLVAGQSITLADGRVITPEMVLGESIPGAKLVHIGDVGRTENLIEHITDANTLVIEATFLNSEADVAGSFGHLTAQQAARLARDHNVGSLILSHISRRYREQDVIAEARSVFPAAYVARDFDHYMIKRGQPVEKLAPEITRQRFRPDPDNAAEIGEISEMPGDDTSP